MQKMMGAILSRYGFTVEVRRGSVSQRVKAFFHPVTSRIAREVSTPLGMMPKGDHVYIGPAEQDIGMNDEVIIGGSEYLVTRAEEYRNEAGVVYRWAVCKRKGGKDTWASQL